MVSKQIFKRSMVAALAAAVLLATPALALFGKKPQTTASSNGSGSALAAAGPVARELEISTYRNIPYRAQFLATDGEGEDLTYTVEQAPKHGTVTVEGADFVYTPTKDKTGSDSFTYVATDTSGNASSPATVSVTIGKVKSGVTYADTEGSTAAAAAQQLAEDGIFTGARIGEQYFFEPERTVSRSEFLAMTMETVGLDASQVRMTGFCDDAAIPTWAKAYAATGLAEGVVQGVSTSDGVAFQGDEPVTYNEAAAILNRVLSVNDVDLTTWYADREAVPSWAAQAVGNMESVSVMATGSFGSGALENGVTRADAAQMLAAAQTLVQGEDVGVFDWLK